MGFLPGGSARGGHDQFHLGQTLGGAAAFAEEGQGGDTLGLRLLQRRQDVRGVAAGGENHEEIAGPAQAGDLAREDLIETEIVADAGDERAVRRQRDRRQRLAGLGVAADEFGRQMRRFGGAAAIAGAENFTPAAQSSEDKFSSVVDRRPDRA